jgi:hypothetical protein
MFIRVLFILLTLLIVQSCKVRSMSTPQEASSESSCHIEPITVTCPHQYQDTMRFHDPGCSVACSVFGQAHCQKGACNDTDEVYAPSVCICTDEPK